MLVKGVFRSLSIPLSLATRIYCRSSSWALCRYHGTAIIWFSKTLSWGLIWADTQPFRAASGWFYDNTQPTYNSGDSFSCCEAEQDLFDVAEFPTNRCEVCHKPQGPLLPSIMLLRPRLHCFGREVCSLQRELQRSCGWLTVLRQRLLLLWLTLACLGPESSCFLFAVSW